MNITTIARHKVCFCLPEVKHIICKMFHQIVKENLRNIANFGRDEVEIASSSDRVYLWVVQTGGNALCAAPPTARSAPSAGSSSACTACVTLPSSRKYPPRSPRFPRSPDFLRGAPYVIYKKISVIQTLRGSSAESKLLFATLYALE